MKIYLMGGLGNCLYQLEHARACTSKSKDVIAYTNIISSKLFNNLVGWTYHEPSIIYLDIPGVKFKKRPILLFLLDLVRLFIALRKTNNRFLGVQWESQVYFWGVNFGYFQYHRYRISSLEIDLGEDRFSTVVHVRLGDSPTINFDFNRISKLLRIKEYAELVIVTNDVSKAKSLFPAYQSGIVRYSVIDDFKILANAECLIASSSTFSHFAAFQSKKLQTVYSTDIIWDKLGFTNDKNVKFYGDTH